jgi:hypothetical protein
VYAGRHDVAVATAVVEEESQAVIHVVLIGDFAAEKIAGVVDLHFRDAQLRADAVVAFVFEQRLDTRRLQQ